MRARNEEGNGEGETREHTFVVSSILNRRLRERWRSGDETYVS